MAIRKSNPTFRGSLSPAHQIFATLGAVIPHEATIEQITEPGYWHSQAKALKPGGRIRCEWECGSRTVLLRVIGKDAGAKEVLVTVEEHREFPAPELPEGFALQYVNAGIGWRILQDGRREPRRTGFATAQAAAHWLRNDRGPEIAAEAKASVAPPLSAPKPTKPKAPPAKQDVEASA